MIRRAARWLTDATFAARAVELKTLRVVFVRQSNYLSTADALAHNSLSGLTCFAIRPLSRVNNPRGLRDALAATRRDALAATQTDRTNTHGARAADPTEVQVIRPEIKSAFRSADKSVINRGSAASFFYPSLPEHALHEKSLQINKRRRSTDRQPEIKSASQSADKLVINRG